MSVSFARRRFPREAGVGVTFRSRWLLCALKWKFGNRADCGCMFCALVGTCLVRFVDSFRVMWEAIMGDLGILVGQGLGMV